MKPLSDIFTVILSLLVAIPLCCCSARAGHLDEAAGCCQTKQESGETGHDPMLCACDSHDARDKPETVRLPDGGATDTITPVAEPNFAPSSVCTMMISIARPWIIDDPLGDVFARYSRWII